MAWCVATGLLGGSVLNVGVFSVDRSRTVTRGVNKNVKEDFRIALEKQVLRCNENVVDVIRTFLKDEEMLLKQCLLWGVYEQCLLWGVY